MRKFHVLQAQIKLKCPLTLTMVHLDTCKKCVFHTSHEDKNGDLDLIEINCSFTKKKNDANIYYKAKIL